MIWEPPRCHLGVQNKFLEEYPFWDGGPGTYFGRVSEVFGSLWGPLGMIGEPLGLSWSSE